MITIVMFNINPVPVTTSPANMYDARAHSLVGLDYDTSLVIKPEADEINRKKRKSKSGYRSASCRPYHTDKQHLLIVLNLILVPIT